MLAGGSDTVAVNYTEGITNIFNVDEASGYTNNGLRTSNSVWRRPGIYLRELQRKIADEEMVEK